MLKTISIFVFRKKYHRISDVRLDTLKSTRYGYQMEHWLLMRFAFLESAGTSYNGCLLLTGRNDEMKAEGWKLGVQWYFNNKSLFSVGES